MGRKRWWKRSLPAGLFLFLSIAAALPAAGRGEEGEPGAAEPRELVPGTVEAYQGPPIDAPGEYVPTAIKGIPEIDMEGYRLRVDGLVATPLSLSYEEALALPRYTKTVEIVCVEGWHARLRWTGLLVEDLLEAAGAEQAAQRIIFHGVDGYTTSHSRSYLQREEILLAFGVNGQPLPPEFGFPFHLVAEARYGYKWAKWVTRIEVSADEEYRGYWERRGFSREGRVGEQMYQGR